MPDQPALENLIGITQNLVQGTVWYVSAMAQRASAMEKINASIEYVWSFIWLADVLMFACVSRIGMKRKLSILIRNGYLRPFF